MKPTVGRIVHFLEFGQKTIVQAAMITAVYNDHDFGPGVVDLIVFPAGAMPHPATEVHYSEVYEHGHWTWPKRDDIT